jgi:hypothetical protein
MGSADTTADGVRLRAVHRSIEYAAARDAVAGF